MAFFLEKSTFGTSSDGLESGKVHEVVFGQSVSLCDHSDLSTLYCRTHTMPKAAPLSPCRHKSGNRRAPSDHSRNVADPYVWLKEDGT
jgi:hypothetical protein